MPKRSNAFQSVVFLLKQHLAGDAKVTESAELTDLVSGTLREVDVCIEAEIAGHAVCIGIECRDHKRRQSVGWVEEMHSKHDRLPTDRLVLVSSSGFTAEALDKAKSYGIETIIPEELTDEQASKIAARVRMVFTRMDMQIEIVRAWVGASETGPPEVVLTAPNNDVFDESGNLITSMLGLTQAAMIQAQPKFGELIFDAPEDIKRFEVTVNPPEIKIGDVPEMQKVYLQKKDPALHLRQIEKIEIEGAAKLVRADVPLRNNRLQGITYSWGEAVFDGKQTVFVATEGAEGPPDVSFKSL
jgi:hypothetical protein